MSKKICKYCKAVQSYPRKCNGIWICNECEKPLPLPEKKPESAYIPMSSGGHSKPLSK